MRPSVRRSLLTALSAAVIVAVPMGIAVAGGGRTVEVRGGGTVEINKALTLDFRFDQDQINARRGEVVTWRNAGDLPDFHTVAIVNKADLPTTLDEVFACGEPGTVCDELLRDVPEDPSFKRLGDDGGLDERGDLLLLGPGGDTSAPVTGASGATLHYMCLIHPWMQASIRVRKS